MERQPMKTLWTASLVLAVLMVVWATWFYRFTTNTAGGRFYRTDHWKGVTLVIEKDGTSRFL